MVYRRTLLFFFIMGLVLFNGFSSVAGAETEISQKELLERIEAKTAPLILDVRSVEEYAAAHIPGAINIPHDQLKARLAEVETHKDKEIVVHCRSGYRAGVAGKLLRKAGFVQIRDLDGHMVAWEASGYPIQTKTD